MVLKAENLPRAERRRESLSELIEREKHRKKNRALVVWLVLTGTLLAILGTWYLLRPKPVPLPARFRTHAVTRGDVLREVRATGRLEAVTTVQVGAEISGRLATVEVEHNDRVTAGQVLARFDRVALGAQLAQIEATLAASRALLEQARTERERAVREKRRVEHLFSTGSVPEAQQDDAQSAFALAEQRVTAAQADVAARLAAYQVAKTTLDHTLVRSPIDGVVITRNVDPGQTVAASLQAPVLFTVAADLRKMHVLAAVDEADVGDVAIGQKVTFTVNAYPTRTFSGHVTQVRNSPQVIQDVVTYGTEVEVSNMDLALKPGMTATVRIRTATAENVLRVPGMALAFVPPGEQSDASTRVWILSGTSLRSVGVEPGITDGEVTEVTSEALSAGQEVIVELTPEGRAAYGIAH
jgi:HlyD family secretion protein